MFRKNVIYLVVPLIGILLLIDIILTNRNNEIIKQNKALQTEIAIIKTYYDQIGKSTIHSLDIGLRGYAIIPEARFVAPLDNALQWKDSILNNVEHRLKHLNYDMRQFHILKDSVNAYAVYCLKLKQLIQTGKREEFIKIFTADKGAHLYWQYLQCEKNITGFVNHIDAEAQQKYKAALARNHILQIVIFLICVPTLFYTAYHTKKTFRLSELLHAAEADKNKILTEQNIVLEHKVTLRTQEISAQNEEMVAQSEELAAQRDILALQNKKLHEAQKIIEQQNQEIQHKNNALEREVDHRTLELQQANQELISQNTQLEQFSFIVAHNLRAPLARILGLARILELADSLPERDQILQKLVSSTKDMDNVIRDLNTILDIKKHTSHLIEVDLRKALERVNKTLEKEYEETNAQLHSDFSQADKVFAVAPYVESILYNLISNAIKYRHPDRIPIITLKTTLEEEFVCLTVADNGLGIDLSKHGGSMFTLYKRFHLHMEGKGLGLYLIKTQITALGGKIDVKSTPTQGTTFSIYFKR